MQSTRDEMKLALNRTETPDERERGPPLPVAGSERRAPPRSGCLTDLVVLALQAPRVWFGTRLVPLGHTPPCIGLHYLIRGFAFAAGQKARNARGQEHQCEGAFTR